ncbi:MAG TPA: hypothetical protein VKA08_13375 [Balneolales bacterium]|nr:hypothetical protein [Balneolales bacterium]
MPAENSQTSFPIFSGDEHYEEILIRIQHLKELFSLGEEIMPLLEELFLFFNDMTPLLGHVSDKPLMHQGIMPNIARILEAAIDQMTDSTFQIMSQVSDMQERTDALLTAGSKAEENPEILRDELKQIRRDTDSITNALQFHDIVSQKLIHVKKVLGQAQSKLITLFACINNLSLAEDTKKYLLHSLGVEPEEISYILNSFITDNGKLTADREFTPVNNTNPARDMRQDEIDKLFK